MRLHFDRDPWEPSRFAQMHKLFDASNTWPGWRRIYDKPVWWKFHLMRDAKGTPLTLRAWRVLGRRSA